MGVQVESSLAKRIDNQLATLIFLSKAVVAPQLL